MLRPINTYKKTFYKVTIFLFVSINFIFGCKKEISDIGLNVQPDGDRVLLYYSDTTTLSTYTVSEDSLTSYRNSENLLGCYFDPVFGKAKASFLTHVRLSSQNVNFHTNGTPVANSIVLYLEKANSYGNESTPQHIKVYKLNTPIYHDSTYYSDINVGDYYDIADLIGEKTYTPDQIDSTLNITLDSTFANFLLSANISNFVDNAVFLEFFKGIFVTIEDINSEGEGAIVYYDLLSDKSKMVLYYQDTAGSHEFDFVINSNCQRINAYTHDYNTGLSVLDSLMIDNFTVTDSVLYVQGMGGTKAKIKFPFINNWRGLNSIVINKAELIINIETNETSHNDFDLPERMTLRAINENGTVSLLPDDPIYNENNTYFDGYYNEEIQAYKINITRYFQYLLSGNYSDNGLYLFSYDKRITANRVVITSGTHSNKMQLLINYTKL